MPESWVSIQFETFELSQYFPFHHNVAVEKGTDGLLDLHLVTDEDIAKRSSFAVKIGAVTDAAYDLPLSGS